jgi:hypothetical protein
MKGNKLRKLKVKEVSLVDRGANQPAKVVLYKRHNLLNNVIMQKEANESLDKGELDIMPKTPEELQKALDEQVAKNTELTEKLEKATTDFDELKKQLDEAVSKMSEVEKKAAKDEELKKSMPEDVLKRFEELETLRKQDADKLQAEIAKREEMEMAKKAEDEYPNIPGESVQKGKLLQAINKMADDQKEFALSVLKSSDEALAKRMEEKGSGASPTAVSAQEKLDKMADELAKAEGITKAAAFDKVTQTAEGKKLYEETSK